MTLTLRPPFCRLVPINVQRFIGCAAGDKINMQPKETIIQLKRLIGLKFSDPDVQADVPNFMFPIAAGPNDEIFITAGPGKIKCF